MALTVKAWRKAKDITQEQMADFLGVHVNTYINWENNPQKMSIENGIKICEFLEVDFDEVIFLPENATKV